MKRVLVILLLSLLTVIIVMPAAAQDATATVEANPVVIVTEEAAVPSIVCEDGATCNLNEAPDEGEGNGNDTPADPEPWYAKYAAGILGVLASLITIVTGIIIAINKWLENTKASMTGMTGLEWLFKQSPAFIKNLIVALIKQFIRLGGNLEEVLAEVEDEIPFAMKRVTSPAAQSSRTYTSATGAPLTTDYTTTKTDTLPNRPSDGGASGGGTGFPPVR